MRQRHDNEWFLSNAHTIHNSRYQYPDSYSTLHTKIRILCLIHGEFLQTPAKHIYSKTGCPQCAGKYKDTQSFIRQANLVHNNKYQYPDPYVKGNTKIRIICPIHGIFYQTPINHSILGHGCKLCANELNRTLKAHSLSEFVDRSNKIHNDKYSYDNVVYVNNSTKIDIICPTHGIFHQRPGEHLRGVGCPKCTSRYSKPAIKWLQQISTNNNINIQHMLNGGEYRIPNTRYYVDGFCVETNTVYEFYGDYWHGNPNIFDPHEINATNYVTMGELYQRTVKKEQIIRDLGYNLIFIWESDYKKLPIENN
ncbi:MAG: hypothetical protein EO766_12320 [Hydrotalea sp. AMD]|uniref:hypothetical protein n=1 Tax=Hydrotalea sp. AMD TaxID=2501297 RepID=UPI001025F05A|nr:hypothetical protein [Hydrotalea sp. AMD]RWZ87303.1 MAG: hypothetical protein EO766_12320 [Hydrotalea sp. AMD]